MQYPDMPPQILRRFDPADWPAEDVAASFRLWNAARKQFADVHGWPGGFVAMLQEGLAIEQEFRWPEGAARREKAWRAAGDAWPGEGD